jgi:hypothetical protein
MENEPILADVYHTTPASYVPREVADMADRIARSQNCKVILAKESSGYHLYLPCPACLVSHARSELKDPKYAINLSKYFGLGDEFRDLQDVPQSERFDPATVHRNQSSAEERNFKSGGCMRTYQSARPHRFPVDELLAMPSISVRHPEIQTSYRVVNGADGREREAHWEVDPVSGKKCPPPAGKITPILELTPGHPARWYLETYRKFNLQWLADMFRCGFCTKEFPEGKHSIWYRKFPGGWKDTPQHRVIFHSLIDGVPLTWQGRYIEVISEDGLTKHGLNPTHPFGTSWRHAVARPKHGCPRRPSTRSTTPARSSSRPANTRPPSTPGAN